MMTSFRQQLFPFWNVLAGLVSISMILGVLTAPVSDAAETIYDGDVPVSSVEPAAGSTVGVGHPVIVHFTHAISDRLKAERGISVQSIPERKGHFEWISDETVYWIPDHYWAAHSKIHVRVHGMSSGFETGNAVIGTAHIADHTFTVTQNGEILRVMAASMGKPKRPTPIGSFTALSKEPTIKFDSRTIGIPLNDPEGYLLDGHWGVRVTWGGVYVHSAPWSVNAQGFSNVSHGCINLSPENAEWYFNLVHIGDPIIIRA